MLIEAHPLTALAFGATYREISTRAARWLAPAPLVVAFPQRASNGSPVRRVGSRVSSDHLAVRRSVMPWR